MAEGERVVEPEPEQEQEQESEPETKETSTTMLKHNQTMQLLSEKLTNGNLNSKIEAAREIRRMVRKSSKTRSKLADTGVIQPLIFMLSSSNFDARHSSLLALLNLAMTSLLGMDTTSVNDCCDGLENSVTSPANAGVFFIRRVSVTISFKIVVSLVTIDLLSLQTRSSYWLKPFLCCCNWGYFCELSPYLFLDLHGSPKPRSFILLSPFKFHAWVLALIDIISTLQLLQSGLLQASCYVFTAVDHFDVGGVAAASLNKVQIVTAGAVPPLVELLKIQDNGIRELATAAVLTLSSAATNQPIIASSGAAPLLVQILKSGSVQGKVDAVTTLHNLSTGIENSIELLDASAVSPLINLLKDCKKYSKFAEKATSLLEILSNSEEGRIAISLADGGILTLVETVEDGSLISTEHAVGALLSLCLSCRDKYRELILKEGAIPGLLRLTVEGTTESQDRARMLLDLLRDSPQEKKLDSSVLEKIVLDIAEQLDRVDKTAETSK
ncbi:U-box domain-containing protein 4-like [Trifolium pratense]|uniref:U-box domain-containing protein 4-like n=2 Tax=Trifolium TaxID=3898 RepID=A0A2K3P7J8_TRIPR|nr:U-box domain-containing protein 4-like [Trifolium pratense]